MCVRYDIKEGSKVDLRDKIVTDWRWMNEVRSRLI